MKIYKKGQSLIELIVVFTLIALLFPVLIIGLTSSREAKPQQIQRMAALGVMKEAQEAVRSIRDRGWSTILTNGTYHPTVYGSKWILSAGPQTANDLTTNVVIESVYRDGNGSIVTSGGTVDQSTKKITTTISWITPHFSSVSSTLFFTRFRSNASTTSTTKSDFDAGVATGAAIVDTIGSLIPGDGEIILGAGGHGNWCSPDLTSETVDLPKNGVANGVWAIEGKVSAVTGNNASGVSFANMIVDNSNPPQAAIEGTFDGYKTNGLFMDNDFAYIATDNNSKEVVIIDTNQLNSSTKKYSEIGYFNAPGNTSATAVYASGTIGYALVTNKLYTFNLSSKSGSRAQLGAVTLGGAGTEIYVVGNYAYVAIAGAAIEMQIVQISNGGATLAVVGQADVNGLAAKDIMVNGTATRAYIITGSSATQREFFVIDISSKTGTRPIMGSYDTTGMDPRGLALTTGNRVILVGSGGEEYQVVNIASEATPVRCGGMHTTTAINGVSTFLESNGNAFSYIIAQDASSELKIIIGGPGGQYATTGTFISKPIDAGYSVAFNRFSASASEPTQTTLKLQIAISNPANGNCDTANYTFIGPNPNNPTASFYTPSFEFINGSIPLNGPGTYTNPGRCFKYKLFMTTSDITTSPVFNDITVNYSP